MPRIGVAIAVPPPWGRDLQDHRRSFGDPAADDIPTHVTLVPPTAVADEAMDDVDAHLTLVGSRYAAFPLRLRGTATFQPVSPVVFVVVSEGISACELLAEQVRSGPLAQELQFPYHPHVTVAHHLDDAALQRAYDTLVDYDAAFEVTSFSVYVHGEDGRWRPSKQYELKV